MQQMQEDALFGKNKCFSACPHSWNVWNAKLWTRAHLYLYHYPGPGSSSQCCGAGPFLTGSRYFFFTGSGSFSYKNRLKSSKNMFLPSHLYTGSGSGSDQKVPAPAPQQWVSGHFLSGPGAVQNNPGSGSEHLSDSFPDLQPVFRIRITGDPLNLDPQGGCVSGARI